MVSLIAFFNLKMMNFFPCELRILHIVVRHLGVPTKEHPQCRFRQRSRSVHFKTADVLILDNALVVILGPFPSCNSLDFRPDWMVPMNLSQHQSCLLACVDAKPWVDPRLALKNHPCNRIAKDCFLPCHAWSRDMGKTLSRLQSRAGYASCNCN